MRRELAPSPVLIMADGHTLVEATACGFGLGQLIEGFAAPLVASGRLVHVLPQADVAAPPVHALIPVGRKMTAKTRVVLDHLVATLQR
ncbi:DNA-binding transcriptional LysR family regulator [Duganella sp. 3397]|nr:DNA-binding transcriptional LysR family regulator [Duganella sp. 3397]